MQQVLHAVLAPGVWAQAESFALLVVAALFGAAIGYEREIRHRSAGLCTHALIALACCLFMETSSYLFDAFSREYVGDALRIEPAGIFQGIIIAMGFISGGAILKNVKTGRVENLTTACTVMCAGAVGAGVGLGLILLSVGSTILVLFINLFGGRLERDVLGTADPDTKQT